VCGDVVIDVPATSQVHRQVVRKDLDLPPIIGSTRRSRSSTSRCPSRARRVGGATRTGSAARSIEQHGPGPTVDPFGCCPSCTGRSSPATRAVTVAIDDGGTSSRSGPGSSTAALGVAVDIGSTTIAGHLCDLLTGEVLASAGVMNPQIRFGEDLMSRVSYVMMNPGGDRELTAVVREALDEPRRKLVDEAGRRAATDVLEVVLVGNPIMHHLVLGSTRRRSAGAVHAGHRRGGRVRRVRARDLEIPAWATVYVGRASPGTSAPTPPRSSWPRAPPR
jgi:hypothetical protein